MTELIEWVGGWPLAASLAVAVTAGGLRAGRRRAALNEALHELRRPLQAIWLMPMPQTTAGAGVAGSLQMVTAALERLDRAINGGPGRRRREPIPMRPLLESAVARWQARTSLAGGTLGLSWRAGGQVVLGDRLGVMQALDNLIVNAIEHGGPSIVVEARRQGRSLRVSVADSGRGLRPGPLRRGGIHTLLRLMGRRRHGHGLAVVRRVAAAHDGRFALRCSEAGTVAVLDLPLVAGGAETAA